MTFPSLKQWYIQHFQCKHQWSYTFQGGSTYHKQCECCGLQRLLTTYQQ